MRFIDTDNDGFQVVVAQFLLAFSASGGRRDIFGAGSARRAVSTASADYHAQYNS